MKGRKRLDFSDSRFRLRHIFYIHCPGYPRENYLRREIIKYGGKVEGFLSKDVEVLVTNQSTNENRGPSTPISPLSTCTSSSRMYTDSPLTTDTPATAVMTRGKALALQAAKMQCNGSTDVVENSRRLGVRVWSLEAAVRAVKRAKREENRRAVKSDASSNSLQGSKSLKAPFLKVEDASHRYKPLSAEFDIWPIMEYLTKLTIDPGFQHGKLVTPSCTPVPTGDQLGQLSTSKPRVQPLVALQRMNNLDMNKLLEKPGMVEKSPLRKRFSQKEANTKEQKGILKKQQLERKGYCEACLCRYSCLQEHRVSSSHQLFIANADNFSRLDSAISEFYTLEMVVRNFSSLASLFSDGIPRQIREDTSPSPSPSSSLQLSPYTPSKVRDSARHTPLTCVSFHPDASILSYTPIGPHKPLSPPDNLSPICPNFITEPNVLSTPRILKPRPNYLHTVSSPSTEPVRRSYTIPIDSPKLGDNPEITLLIPSRSPEVSSMEWCESIAAPPTPVLLSNPPEEQGDTNQHPRDTTSQDTCFKTPSKQNIQSHVWVGDAKTPPLPKGMDTRLFMFMNYPYRQSKVDAFKKLSKLL